MKHQLTKDSSMLLRRAAEALDRACQGAAAGAPTAMEKQDDDIANAVFAEIAAAQALITRAQQHYAFSDFMRRIEL